MEDRDHAPMAPRVDMNKPVAGQFSGMPETTAQPTEVLAGSIERVTFHSAESGFCVLRIKARGHCDLVTVVGHAAGEPCLLDQLASPEQEAAGPADDLALEQLVDQLPAPQATALRLTILEGLSLRQAAEQLQISAMSVQRAQKKALEALRQQLGA